MKYSVFSCHAKKTIHLRTETDVCHILIFVMSQRKNMTDKQAGRQAGRQADSRQTEQTDQYIQSNQLDKQINKQIQLHETKKL